MMRVRVPPYTAIRLTRVALESALRGLTRVTREFALRGLASGVCRDPIRAMARRRTMPPSAPLGRFLFFGPSPGLRSFLASPFAITVHAVGMENLVRRGAYVPDVGRNPRAEDKWQCRHSTARIPPHGPRNGGIRTMKRVRVPPYSPVAIRFEQWRVAARCHRPPRWGGSCLLGRHQGCARSSLHPSLSPSMPLAWKISCARARMCQT